MLQSKLPHLGTTIFTTISALATKHEAINLGQGFPDFALDEKLVELVAEAMRNGYNQYAPMPGLLSLRQSLSEKIWKSYQKHVEADTEITITAGATQAIFTAITAVVQKDDEVIVIDPAYDCYVTPIELCGGKVVYHSLQAPGFKIDWQRLKSQITPRTRMLILNNPHNPLGTCLDEEDMIQLQKVLEGTDILLLSDEVYEHIVYAPARHLSVLAYPELYKRSFVVFSFGKTFHATGWKLGYIVAPEYLMREFRKVHQYNVFCVNTPMQQALSEYLKDEKNYLGLADFYKEKHTFFENGMKQTALVPLSCAGTYFQLYSYQNISDEKDVAYAEELITEYGVAAIPLSVFYHDKKDQKLLRFCFAKKEETLSLAIERLQRVGR